uniref:Uncharacterized protein n=1 Tax=Rhizophora mucronata TaxID=61149 RepID=A0A2P2QFM1_RHIMU
MMDSRPFIFIVLIPLMHPY